MATYDRRESAPLTESVASRPSSYNFYQAVRLLAPANERDLTTIESLDRAITFATEAGDQFPGSDIYAVTDEEQRALLTLTTFGLTGPLGPLPQQHSERIEAQARDGNDALKKFIGLFEHRLISLLYLVKQKNCMGLHNGTRSHSNQYQYLFNISGLPRIECINSDHQHTHLLPFTGLLAGGKVSTPALTNILSTLLNADVKVSTLKGAFVRLAPDVQARLTSKKRAIGQRKAGQRLGEKNALGGRVWNQTHGIDLEIGPVDWRTANEWVPGSAEYRTLVDLLLYTTNGQWQLRAALLVREETIPISQLNHETRLGFNSWLKTTSDDGGERIRVTRRTIEPSHFH